jgi:cation transport ATPase
MFGKKAASSSRQGEYSSNKRILKDGETCFCNPGCTEKQNSYAKIESVNQQDGCILTPDDRSENYDERAQNQNERAQNHDEHAQNQNERVQTQNERVQYGHAKNQNERVECLNHPVRNQINRSQRRDIGYNSTMNVFQISSKSLKNSQAINNAKEQKFLNTIIIIACIAVVTVAPATIYTQFYATAVAELNPEANMILAAVLISILSLNFAVNPFVYVLRLKRYRKTFKLVYGWD